MNKQIEEMTKIIWDNPNMYDLPSAEDVAFALYDAGYRKASQEGAECPTCHGTGRIGTTDWLTKNISKKQLAKEKAEAVAEYEAQLKRDVAREIFEEIDKYSEVALMNGHMDTPILCIGIGVLAELKKKHESEETKP